MNNNPADKVVSDIQRDFRIVGSSRVHGWYAWAIVGIVFGMALGIIYVANRSGSFVASRAASDEGLLPMGGAPEEKNTVGDFKPEAPFFATDVESAPKPGAAKAAPVTCSAKDVTGTASGEATNEMAGSGVDTTQPIQPQIVALSKRAPEEVEESNQQAERRSAVVDWFNNTSHPYQGAVHVDGTDGWEPSDTPQEVKDTLAAAALMCTSNLPSAAVECGKVCDQKICSCTPAITPVACPVSGGCTVAVTKKGKTVISCTVTSPYTVTCGCKAK